MALQLRPNCEYCDKDLPPASTEARICSYECTFCADCAENRLHNVCPNCGGGFVPRPIRPAKEWRPGRTSACICPTVSTISPHIRRPFGTFRQRNVEPTPSLRGAKATKQSSFASLTLDCFASLAMTEKGRSMLARACSDRTAFPVPSSNRRSRPATSGRWPRAR